MGHSEGTSQFLIGASLMHNFYAKTFNLFVALAPVARVDHSTQSGVSSMASFVNEIGEAATTVGAFNLFPRGLGVVGSFCNVMPSVCNFALSKGDDVIPGVDNVARDAVRAAHFPAGAGWKNIVHYG